MMLQILWRYCRFVKKDRREKEVSENLVGDRTINDMNRSQNVKTKHEPIKVMFL